MALTKGSMYTLEEWNKLDKVNKRVILLAVYDLQIPSKVQAKYTDILETALNGHEFDEQGDLSLELLCILNEIARVQYEHEVSLLPSHLQPFCAPFRVREFGSVIKHINDLKKKYQPPEEDKVAEAQIHLPAVNVTFDLASKVKEDDVGTMFRPNSNIESTHPETFHASCMNTINDDGDFPKPSVSGIDDDYPGDGDPNDEDVWDEAFKDCECCHGFVNACNGEACHGRCYCTGVLTQDPLAFVPNTAEDTIYYHEIEQRDTDVFSASFPFGVEPLKDADGHEFICPANYAKANEGDKVYDLLVAIYNLMRGSSYINLFATVILMANVVECSLLGKKAKNFKMDLMENTSGFYIDPGIILKDWCYPVDRQTISTMNFQALCNMKFMIKKEIETQMNQYFMCAKI